MQVGDLVKESWGLERVGVVVAEVPRPPCRSHRRLFKVLWSTPTISGSLTGPLRESKAEVIPGILRESKAEVINESR